MKRIPTLVIALIYIIICMPAAGAAANYASAEFADVEPVLTNMTMTHGRDNLLAAETRGGIPCVRMYTRDTEGNAVNKSWLVFDISSSYMIRLKDGTGVDITVEYFDEGDGAFCIVYDAREEKNKPTEKVLLNDTKMWKKHTFRLEDAYFANRCEGSDFKLTLHDASMDYSTSDLIFKSVKVEKNGKIFPVNLSENIVNTGNLYDKGSIPKISLSAENISESTIVSNYVCTITNSDGETVKTIRDTITLMPGDNTLKINTGQSKCDTYDVDILFSNSSNLYGTFRTNFAISVVSEANSDYATNTHYRISVRDPKKSMQFARKTGASMIRDGMPMEDCYVSEGVYKPLSRHIAYVDEAIANGLDVCLLLGSQKETNFPQTDTQIKEYGEYVYDMVSAFEGKIEYFEIWNEFHHTAYKLGITTSADRSNPSDAAATAYVKVLKEAYTRAKQANPDCKIIGLGGLPAVWDGWINKTLKCGAGNYMDVMSLHEYDENDPPEAQMMGWLGKVKSHIEKYNCGHIPIWITEAGWSTTLDVSQTEKLKYSFGIRQYVLYKEFGIDKYFWYDMKSDGVSSRDIQDNYGTIWYHEDREHIPYSARGSYLAFANMNDKLGNADVSSHITDENGTEIYCFTNDLGENTYVLWNVLGTYSARIALDTDKKWRLFDAFGNDSRLEAEADGKYTVAVSDEPVYISAPRGLTIDLIQNNTVAESIAQLDRNSETEVEAVFENAKGMNSEYLFICTMYNEGVLVDVRTQNGQLSSGEDFEAVYETLPPCSGGFDKIKIYMFEDGVKLIPLSGALEWAE